MYWSCSPGVDIYDSSSDKVKKEQKEARFFRFLFGCRCQTNLSHVVVAPPCTQASNNLIKFDRQAVKDTRG